MIFLLPMAIVGYKVYCEQLRQQQEQQQQPADAVPEVSLSETSEDTNDKTLVVAAVAFASKEKAYNAWIRWKNGSVNSLLLPQLLQERRKGEPTTTKEATCREPRAIENQQNC